MTKITSFLLSLILLNFYCFADELPYKLNNYDYLWVGGSIAGLIVADQIKVNTLNDEEIAKLDKNSINSFDRFATDNYNKNISKISDYMLVGSVLIPAINFTKVQEIKDIGTVSGMYIESLLLTNAVTTITKTLVQRNRPYTYNSNVPNSEKIDIESKVSFFSGHSSNVFMNCVFAAKVFDDLNPNSSYTPWVWGTCLTYATTVAVLRVKAGAHFPTDVITGALVGSAIGYLVPELHKFKYSQSSLTPATPISPNYGYRISYSYSW